MWFTEIPKHTKTAVNTMLVGNKSDLENRQVSFEEGKAIADVKEVKFVEASAKSASNVNDAFLTMVKEIKGRVICEETKAEQTHMKLKSTKSLTE
jgi:Ras-related protein Rab-1A